MDRYQPPSSFLERLKDCADEVHDIKDKYGTVIFLLSFMDWMLRKLAQSAKVLPKNGSWSQLRLPWTG